MDDMIHYILVSPDIDHFFRNPDDSVVRDYIL